MKAITLWQPWASLIMIGAKPWEFRSWSYIARGVGVKPGDRIGIHAGARPIKPLEIADLLERLDDPTNSTGLIPAKARQLLERINSAHKCRGVVEMSALLGTAIIGTPKLSREVKPEWAEVLADSDRLEHSNWAWPMTDIEPAIPAIPMRGAQGFFNVEAPARLK